MPMASTILELQDVFREVFGDDEIVLATTTTAADIDGWDSIMHINLIVALESRFGVKFAVAEISKTKGDDQNIGTLIEMLEPKFPPTSASRP
jgi:acyl carrier protein